MNKKKLMILLISTFIICSAAAQLNASVSINIGATAWYNFWNPIWGGGTWYAPASLPGPVTVPFSVKTTVNRYKTVSYGMYGPLISISFLRRWSISSVFLMGKFRSRSEGPLMAYVFPIFKSEYIKDIIRGDSDSTIGFRANRYIKIFAGFKYQWYKYDETAHYVPFNISSSYAYLYTFQAYAEFASYGPALGLNITVPLIKGLHLGVSLSTGHFWDTAYYNFKKLIIVNIFGPGPFANSIFNKWAKPYKREYLRSISENVSLSFIYLIPKTSLALSLGGRYQLLYFYYQKPGYWGFIDYKGRLDHIYGVTLSIVYSFKIGKL